MPPVLQGFGAFLVGAPRRLLDPAGGVQGDPGDLLGGEAPLGVIDGQETVLVYWVLGLLGPPPQLVQGQVVGYCHGRVVQQERV